MKQLLFIIFSVLIGLNTLNAQETNPIEETTWNVIRERLFSGENPKAIRFEDDILIQLKGDANKQDSAIVNEIISELKGLIGIVDVRLVDKEGNFVFTIQSAENGTSTRFITLEKGISIVEIHVGSNDNYYQNEKHKYFQYNIITHLTKTFEPRFGKTGYFGFFDTSSYEEARSFNDIDKDLLRKLYSKDFYKNLKKNTVKKLGYLYYLNLRFESWVKLFSYSVGIILIIVGFLYLLSREHKNQKLNFWTYQKMGFLVIIWISFIEFFFTIQVFLRFKIFGGFWLYFLGVFNDTILPAIFIPTILYCFDRYLLSRSIRFFQKQIFIFITTLISIIISSIVISALLGFSNFETYISASFLTVNLIFYNIFFATIISGLRIFHNLIRHWIESIVNQKDVELAKMKELKNQAELNALHSRINPHFLYNSLNSIASLAHINPDKTENMATALSELFRYSINKEDKTFVTVREELEMVKKYLEIEQTRFGDKIIYSIEAEENVQEKLIPKFLIQPLAENAIKHGLSKIKEVGKITIEVKQIENDLVIAIFDNGPDFPEEPVSGYGLQNLNDKLEILYGKDAYINWVNGANKHFKITIKNQFKDEANL